MAIAPILQVLAAGGVLGGRELVRRKRIDTARSASTELLDSYQAAGLVDDATLQQLRELNQFDPNLASTAATNISKSIFDKQKFEADTQYRNADLGMRRDMLTVSQANADLARDRFTRETELDARDRALYELSLRDPAAAEALAFRQGKDEFAVVNEDGSMGLVPVQGSKLYREDVDTYTAQLDGLELVNEMVQLVNTEGFLANPSSPEAQRYMSLKGQLTSIVKTAEKLGTLDEGVANLVDSIFADAGSLRNLALSTPEAVAAGLQQGSQLFRRALETQGRRMRNHRGLDPELGARTQQALQVNDALSNQEAATRTPQPATEQPSPLVTQSSPMGLGITFPEIERRARMGFNQLTGDEEELAQLQAMGAQEFIGGPLPQAINKGGSQLLNLAARFF